MNLKEYNWPEITMLDAAFPTLKAQAELLEEAKRRGFYEEHTPYNKLFTSLFFAGGKVQFKKDCDKELKEKAWPWVVCFMRSVEPKHEDKEAICALIFSELLEPGV